MSIYKEENDLLKRSIDSLLEQTLEDWELILVDDGATPENLNLINSYSDKRINLIKNEVNLGLTKSLNKAFRESSGEYIARLDSDDFCLPDRLMKQVEHLKNHQDLVLVGSAYDEIVEGEKVTQSVSMVTGSELINKCLPQFNPFAHSTLMVKREPFEKLKGYDEYFRYAQDYDLVFRLSKIGKMDNINEVLVVRNISTENISFKRFKQQLRFALRTRLRAAREYGCDFRSFVLFVKSFVVLALPQSLTLYLKKLKA